MISSVGSASTGLLAAVMKNTTVTQDVNIAVMKKNQDIEKANGDSALKLIASAAPIANSGGIDIHV